METSVNLIRLNTDVMGPAHTRSGHAKTCTLRGVSPFVINRDNCGLYMTHKACDKYTHAEMP